MRRTQRARRAASDRALIDAANRLIAERGVDGCTVGDVGTSAGYSTGLVNHRFGSKAELLRAVASESQQRLGDLIPARPDDELAVLVGLPALYLAWVTSHTDEARAFLTMWGSAIPTGALLHEVFTEVDDWFRQRAMDLIDLGRRHGTIRADCDPASTAVLLMAMVRGTAVQHLIAPDAIDLEAAAAVHTAVLRQQCEPRTAVETRADDVRA